MARLLSIGNPALYDMERRDIGDFAELGLWLLLGITTEEARAIVGTSPFKAGVDKLFLALIEALPTALAAVALPLPLPVGRALSLVHFEPSSLMR